MHVTDRHAVYWQLLRALQLFVVVRLPGLSEFGSEAARPEEQLVSVRPLTFVIPDFATQSECEDILKLIERCHTREWSECQETKSHLAKASKTPRTEGNAGKRPLRNSTSFMLTLPGEINGTVDAIVKRSHLVARHPITYGEGVQIASYHAGDYYGFHHDSLMRRATLLVYLTDVPEGDGGETIFPLVRAPGIPEDAKPPLPPAVAGHRNHGLDFKVKHMEEMERYCASDYYLKIRPEAGKAILFYSYGPDYRFDEYAIHGACPLRRGHKAILQRWMRFEENALVEKADEAVRHARLDWGHDRLLQPDITKESSTEAPSQDKTGLDFLASSLRASIDSRGARRRHSSHLTGSYDVGAQGSVSNDTVSPEHHHLHHHHHAHAAGAAGSSAPPGVNPWEL